MDYKDISDILVQELKEERHKDIVRELSFVDRFNFIKSVLNEEINFSRINNVFQDSRFGGSYLQTINFMRNYFTNEEARELLNRSDINSSTLLLMAILCISNDEEKETNLIKYCDRLGIFEISSIIGTFKDDKIKEKWFDKYIEEIDGDVLEFIIMSFSDEKTRIKFFEKVHKDATGSLFSEFLLSISNEMDRIEYYLKFRGHTINDRLFIENILPSISDSVKKEFIRKNISNTDINRYFIYDIVVTINDDEYKTHFLEEYKNIIDYTSFGEVLASINSDSIKATLFRKYYHEVYDNHYYTNAMQVVASLKDDQLKLQLLNEFVLNSDDNYMVNNDARQVIETLKSDELIKKVLDENEFIINDEEFYLLLEKFENDSLKEYFFEKYIAYLKNEDRLEGTFISPVICSFKNDKKRIEYFNKYKEEIGDYYIYDVIYSIKNEKLRLEEIEKNLGVLNSGQLENLLGNLKSDESFIKYALEYRDYLFPTSIPARLSFIEDDNLKMRIFIEFKSNFDKNKDLDLEIICGFIESLSNEENKYKMFLYFEDMLEKLSFKKYELCGFCHDISSLSKEAALELESYLDEIRKMYGSEQIATSDLKALIGVQAKENFSKERDGHKDFYLPENLAERLVRLSKGESLGSLKLNVDFLKYYRRMNIVIEDSLDEKTIANFLITLHEKNIRLDDDLFIEKFLDLVNIKKPMEGPNGKIINDRQKDLYFAYFNAIKETFMKSSKSISDLYGMIETDNLQKRYEIYLQRAKLLKEMFLSSTNKVFEESFKDNNKVEGKLLTQLGVYCLNIEKRKYESLERLKLEKLIIKELLLTDKGKELIDRKRIETILKNDPDLRDIFESQNIKFNQKMDAVFSKLYPDYVGVKNLKTLGELMIKDPRYSAILTKQPTIKEKRALPLEAANFRVNSRIQLQKLIVAVLNSVNRDKANYGGVELNPIIKKRLKSLIENLRALNSESKQHIELLSFDELELVRGENIENLILYFSKVAESLIPRDKDGRKKTLCIDNLTDFVESVKKMSTRNSREGIVLTPKVVDILEHRSIEDNYIHYTEKTAKRFYRTIPDIKGIFDSNGRKLNYGSYDMCDPEQLIAGARMLGKVKKSCFQIGHAQDATIRYITSSPHGIIVAITDETGRFMGRVYGFRYGNAVHFTRMYYNEEFDFKTAMEKIAKDIISNSSEIDYVTCIPNLSTERQYIKENIISCPNDITKIHDGNTLNTDHYGRNICVVASRQPVDINNIANLLNDSEPTEKFYKRRRPKKILTIDKDKEDKIDFSEVTKIIYCSECDVGIIDHLMDARQIIYGEDWVIIDFEGKEPVKIMIDYTATDDLEEESWRYDEAEKDAYEKEKEERSEYSAKVAGELYKALLELKKQKEISESIVQDDGNSLKGV
ncbi:MAG: hypothetical protein IKR57_04090 [Bacilli bacterium]|nr:hypothetical protein [Bacilli bacterium]